MSEKMIFTKNHPLLSGLNKKVRYHVLDGEFELKAKIKYLLLEALRADRRNDDYSDTVAQTIRVLSEIRKRSGITTAEFAGSIERSTKTVQRYITTLNGARQFIDYRADDSGDSHLYH